MKYVVFDFETASDCDLQKRGAWVYSAEFSTFILCLAYKVVEDKQPRPTRVLTESEIARLDPELMALALDPDVKFVAHNASFEAGMWKHHMVPLGYPPLPPEKMHDTMAVAAMKALPLGLDALTKALDLPVQKDMEGHRLMLRMCKKNIKGEWEHSEGNMTRLKEYCVGDVDAQYGSHVILGGLGASEREAWVIDQKIQQRGIRVDTKFVHACIDVLEQVREPMAERFRELTDGVKFTQREKILNWVNDQGVPLGDMKKETLNAILDPDDEFDIGDFSEPLPYHVHEVLTLRRTLASSSVSKLERMLMCAGHDGRVRYTTQYHGARTGRDAGRLMQIQNYPVGEIGDRQGLTADILADAILTRDLPTIREVWGPDIFSAIISSLRSCIVPAEGKVLVAGDYAAIEARNLLSMAGQHDRVAQMHAGVDMYNETASAIFRRPIDRKVQQKEGKIGKQTFLGCLASDTQVLTHTGWKAIVEVTDMDLLWDGVDWVTHQGLKFKGVMKTLNLSGLRMTPDHLVFTGVKWLRADAVTPEALSQSLGFAKDCGPFSALHTRPMAVASGMSANAAAAMDRDLLNYTTFNLDAPLDATNALKRKPFGQVKSDIGVMKTYAWINRIAPGFLTAYPLSSAVALIRNQKSIPTTEGVESNSILRTVGSALPISSRLKDGITRLWKLIASTMTGTTPQAISDLLQKLKMLEINGTLEIYKIDWMARLEKSSGCEPVYDLVNAGPRNRFTVMTCDGPLIVHNSGYGLGPVGFRARFAPKESIELAKMAISAYRKDIAPLVPKFWYGVWEASVNAVWCRENRTYSFAGVEFRKLGDYLTMRLPSGRLIWYHRPRKATTWDPQGNERPSWKFMSYQGKKFRWHLAWHGMVTADCIQGSARCIMFSAMKRMERENIFTVFKVHDELVVEEPDRPDLVTTVKQIMEDVDPWTHERRFKVVANVESMMRYRK